MDQKNIKRRDVVPYDEFTKAYETVKKVVLTKKGQNPDPGAHEIEGEGLYSRNDANPYKAFGIPHDEKTANAADFTNANHVDVEDVKHDGKDQGKGVKEKELTQPAAVPDKKVTKEVEKISHLMNVGESREILESKAAELGITDAEDLSSDELEQKIAESTK